MSKLKLKLEKKAKELVLAQLEEEQRLEETSEVNGNLRSKRKLEALFLKLDRDFQLHEHEIQRLEQKYGCLKEEPSLVLQQTNAVWTENSNGVNLEDSRETEGNWNRVCMKCMKDEVSVVFLPCAHQVICLKCNDKYGRRGKSRCPCCLAPIQQRILVYGSKS